MCPESESIYGEFRDMFDYFDTTNLLVSTETDLSATWKGLGRGGAAKVNKCPCHCCSILSDNLVCPNDTLCQKWYSNNNTCSCYH